MELSELSDNDKLLLMCYEVTRPLVLTSTRSRLIIAIIQDNVDAFRDLLVSPEWYNTKYKKGNNLLQIAIIQDSCKIFDYILSLPDYPLDYENNDGKTALLILLLHKRSNAEYYACELIKKGACIDQIDSQGNTLLHRAVRGGFVEVTKLLIDKGLDVNNCNFRGETPLELVGYLRDDENYNEIITMLLLFGADTSFKDASNYNIFEIAVDSERPQLIQEILFYYTYDEFSSLEIHLEIVLQLAANHTFLFDEIINQSFKIIVNAHFASCLTSLQVLSSISLTCLEDIIKKLETPLKIYLTLICEEKYRLIYEDISIERLNVFLESSLKDETMDLINSFSRSFFKLLFTIFDESTIMKYFCYLLSYGLEIDEHVLHLVYKKFGFYEFFKILLHMDLKKENLPCLDYYVMSNFIINVTETLPNFLRNYATELSFSQLEELKRYFSNFTLHSCDKNLNLEANNKRSQFPRLEELSRNVFRSYFVDKFQIKTCKTFFLLLNCLQISSVHKKIITYETKLYG